MFGLHSGPFVSVGALCVIIVAFLITFAHQRNKDRVNAALSLLGIFMSILITLPAYTIPSESRLDERDKAIAAKLQPAGINVVGYTFWDDRITVLRDNCRATYAIQETLPYTEVWPLAKGTATNVQGCNDNPDKVFIP